MSYTKEENFKLDQMILSIAEKEKLKVIIYEF